MLIAIVMGLSTAYYMMKKRGIWSKRIILLLLISLIAFFIGARLFHFLINPDFYLSDTNNLFRFHDIGFALYGGLIFAFIISFITMYLLKINKNQFLDSISPPFYLSLAIMRIGCFLNGCCFGKVTTMPWGVAQADNFNQRFYEFLIGFKDTRVYHPTQLYELFAAISISLLTFYLTRKKLPDGAVFLIAAILFTFFRLINHYFLYIPNNMIYSGDFYPYLYLLIILLLGLVLIHKLIFKLNP